MTALQIQWESTLKAEGLAPLDGSYRKKSHEVCYAIPERIRFGVHSKTYAFEFFSLCEEFSSTDKVKWPDIWQPFSQGDTYRKIADKLKLSAATVCQRIKIMRKDMRDHFAHTNDAIAIPPEAEILEIFVEQQKKGY